MTIYLLTFLIIALLIVAMAVGVLAGRAPIAGSCGGLGKLGLECDMGCEKPCPKRLARLQAREEAESSNRS
ncbi:(Na+)-NQR maturation NqrM [Pseudothauera nasutitermitis]|uniref:(Na+)-NQR maturation NqrM n=1 Tax=Pseudothauera nasutitermitis TaxID=2565930 RepID=A0A4S4B447_9RHOO|nr:(Na+)-NQR maturation NqrM [Pseudothauera nasutitermitis]THF67480.1 (Na+)-NQR maturation NqrM [Pseudothauera nasutitermitis]